MTDLNGRKTVVLTDHPWPDLELEEKFFSAAGITFVAGPVQAPSAESVEQMVAQVDPSAILTCWARVSGAAIRAPRNLAIVARLGVGLDNIDVAAATTRGAWVTNVPDYCVGEVADHAIAMMLAACRGVVALDRLAKLGHWAPEEARLRRTSELVVGIIGYGRIGRATAARLRAFGCRVLAYARTPVVSDPFADYVDLNTIQSSAHVIILHVPLTADTEGLVGADFLHACTRCPLIINVSRGGLVDNEALLAALETGQISGAALDVIDGEPTPPISILNHPRVIVTPHVAFSSDASILELRRRACEEVLRVLGGSAPLNACNQPGIPLAGGVANDVTVVDTSRGKEVVKRALGKLRVRAEWFADPGRSATEVAALRVGAELLGTDVVPHVLWEDSNNNTFAMEFIPPPFESWKERLLGGSVESVVAHRAGELLARLHRTSSSRRDIADRFYDVTNFDQLRIDPFFRRTAAAVPALSAEILAAAAGMERRRISLVHGDYSPKNLLTDGRRIFIIDWEVTHWGDSRFDVAFCLSHLILKAYRKEVDGEGLLECAQAFSSAYRAGNPGNWDPALAAITGALLVTRIAGPSPIDYLASVDTDAVMSVAGHLLRGEIESADLNVFSRTKLDGVSRQA